MPPTSLELVSPAALVTPRRPSGYAEASMCSAAVITSLAVCVGVGYVGLLGAIIAATTWITVCLAATRSRRVQRGLAWRTHRRARARRESARQRALFCVPAGRQEQYEELRRIVERIEGSDPVDARRLELQDLLDRFVRLSVAHQRCGESLLVAGRSSESHATTSITEQSPSNRRRDIAARRVRLRDETTARLQGIADEIGSADDLIRLIAQRMACKYIDALLDSSDEIDGRLVELEEVEAALVQISA